MQTSDAADSPGRFNRISSSFSWTQFQFRL
jgi:hypothetical protein